jgi:hypothetical protein
MESGKSFVKDGITHHTHRGINFLIAQDGTLVTVYRDESIQAS